MLYDLLKICVSIFFNGMNVLLGGKLPPFGSAAIIVEEENNYLVVALPRGRIVFPGGFMTWRENPRQAAEREGQEETGYELRADDLVDFYASTTSNWFSMSSVSFMYHGTRVGGELRNSPEGRPCWLSETELRQRLDQSTQSVLDDYLRYREKKLKQDAA